MSDDEVLNDHDCEFITVSLKVGHNKPFSVTCIYIPQKNKLNQISLKAQLKTVLNSVPENINSIVLGDMNLGLTQSGC
jgi:hypothetical protein